MSEQGNITGVVHFRLYNSIETESLELKLSSEEHYWEEMDKRTTRYVDKSLSIEQLFPIFVFQNSQVATGDYSFPFLFVTPATLPVSFYYYIQPTLAHLTYWISAYINSASAKVKKAKTVVGLDA